MASLRLGMVLACLWLTAGTVHAQPTDDAPAPDAAPDAGPDAAPDDAPPAMSEAEAKAAARKLLDGGDGFLKAGDKLAKRKKTAEAEAQYQRALAAYQKAYELVPNPQILFPVALAEDKLAMWPEAARDYHRFLTQVATPDPGLKAEAEKRLEAAKLNLGVLTLTVQPDGAHVSLGGTELGVTPLADPLYLLPGEYTLSFTADGYQPLEQSVAVEAGSESERTFDLKAIEVIVEPPRPPPPPPPKVVLPPAPSKLPLYLGGGLTIGLLGGATAAGIMAIGKHGDFTDTSATAQAREDARVTGRRLALITDGLIAGTIVAAGVVSFYYFKVYRPKARLRRAHAGAPASPVDDELSVRPKLRVAPWVQAGAGGLTVAGEL